MSIFSPSLTPYLLDIDCVPPHSGRSLTQSLHLPAMTFFAYRDHMRRRAQAVFYSQPPTRVYRLVEAELTSTSILDVEFRAMRNALLRFVSLLEVYLLQEYSAAMYGNFPLVGTPEYKVLVSTLAEVVFGYDGPDRPVVEAFLEIYRKHATE